MAGAIFRDAWGVPHLWAESATKLAYLQGANAATDRAWQLETERWRGEGRLAAHIGPEALPWDRFARRARLADTARRAYAGLDPVTRRWIRAYVAGVNDTLPAAAGRAPEFADAGYAPGRWQPWTPLAIFLVQHALFAPFPHTLWRDHLTGALGAAGLDLFAAGDAGSAGSTGGSSSGSGSSSAGGGSNAWALAPAASPSGAPLLAGDPHRVLELPGVYQQVRLACPEFDVVGLAFPGVPGVPHFGHTGAVAWGITHAMADYQDLYREQLRHDRHGVWVADATGWVRAHAHTERIRVRGDAPTPVTVVETPRGPVVDTDRYTGEGLSLRTPARVLGDLGFGALLPLLRARSVDDVAAALRRWVEPVNSVLVADAAGEVRSLVAGYVPRRDPRGHRCPVPGRDPRYAWPAGPQPLPETKVTGAVVHANDRRPEVAPLGTEFASPRRADRIRALLAVGAAPEEIHRDTLLAPGALHRLLAGLSTDDHDARSVQDAQDEQRTRALRDRLVAWDGHMCADSADAGAFAAWRSALVRRLADHPRLRALARPSAFDALYAPWTDPVARLGHCLEAVMAGLPGFGIAVAPLAAVALRDVATGAPPEAWGRRHTLFPVRTTAGTAPGPAAASPAPAGTGLAGDTDCVLATVSTPGVTDVCARGPVARYVWDLADRARSRWVVPFGAAGRPDSPHADDQLSLWTAGELAPIVTDWNQLATCREAP